MGIFGQIFKLKWFLSSDEKEKQTNKQKMVSAINKEIMHVLKTHCIVEDAFYERFNKKDALYYIIKTRRIRCR